MPAARSTRRLLPLCAAAWLVTGCGSAGDAAPTLREVPGIGKYCQAAQKFTAGTDMRIETVIHDDFDAFVKSKAIIDGPNGPQIQQYNWYDDNGEILGISCKLKTAEHLNLEFGESTAGAEGSCQALNREVFRLMSRWVREPAYTTVSFDAAETVSNEEQPGMTGPDWLAPFEMTYVGDDGGLHVRSKGFVVEFTDPRYERAPPRFRGVHYCHYIAPDHLAKILKGEALPGATIGRLVDTSGPPPATGG